mgnify:CR=1 FL=1
MKRHEFFRSLAQYDLYCLVPSSEALGASLAALQLASSLSSDSPVYTKTLIALRRELSANSRAALQQDGLLSAVFAESTN